MLVCNIHYQPSPFPRDNLWLWPFQMFPLLSAKRNKLFQRKRCLNLKPTSWAECRVWRGSPLLPIVDWCYQHATLHQGQKLSFPFWGGRRPLPVLSRKGRLSFRYTLPLNASTWMERALLWEKQAKKNQTKPTKLGCLGYQTVYENKS